MSESFQERLARLRAERAAAEAAAAPPAPPTPDYDESDAPSLDETELSPERQELDSILAGVDILQAYSRWCGKMVPDPRGKREGIMISCPNPAHPDKVPSAWINLDKQTYFCGGCQEGGDKFDIARMHFGVDYRNDSEQFVALKKMMALDLGWMVQRTMGGQSIVTQVTVENDSETDSESSTPDMGTTNTPSSMGDNGSNPEQALATVTPLPAAQDAEEEEIRAELPKIDWRTLLPEGTFLKTWMETCSEDDLPEEYYFWLGMQALGASVGRDVVLNDIPTIKPNIFICLLGPSGVGKSRSASILTELLRQALPYDYSDPNSKGTKVVPPVSSSENLIDQFARPVEDPTNPKKIAYHAPVRGLVKFEELSLLVGKANRVGNPMKPVLMEFFDGSPVVEVSSRGSGHVKAVDPFCQVISTTQPRAIKELITQADVDSGFMNRWIFAVGPAKQAISYRTDMMDLTASVDLLRRCRSWSGMGKILNLEGDARQAWDEFFHGTLIDDKLNDETNLITRVDLLIKKCIILFCINEHSAPTREIVERACALYGYLVQSYRYLSGHVGMGAFEDVHLSIIDAVSSFQKKRGKNATVTVRDIARLVQRFKFPTDLLIKVVRAMVELGELEEEVVVSRNSKRQTVKYRYIS